MSDPSVALKITNNSNQGLFVQIMYNGSDNLSMVLPSTTTGWYLAGSSTLEQTVELEDLEGDGKVSVSAWSGTSSDSGSGPVFNQTYEVDSSEDTTTPTALNVIIGVVDWTTAWILVGFLLFVLLCIVIMIVVIIVPGRVQAANNRVRANTETLP